MAESPELNVLLAGAGHAHLHVVAQAARLRAHLVRLTLIDPGTFWYSGLATGVLAGQHPPTADQVDPGPLARHYGVAFHRARVAALDSDANRATLDNGLELDYDALSLNLGSVVRQAHIAGAGEHAVPVKPIANLWAVRQRAEAHWRRMPGTPFRAAVVGGGATGSETAACLMGLARRYQAPAEVHLLARGPRLMPAGTAGAAASLARALTRRGVQIHYNTSAQEIGPDYVRTEAGATLPTDVTITATGLVPPPLMRELGLPVDDAGGLRVGATLQSERNRNVFAVGDCARLEGHDLPKLGVYGVRQAPVLTRNLAALATGAPLENYTPQRLALMILNLGDGEALALRGARWWRGRSSRWLKERLDRPFVRKYQVGGPPPA